MCSSDLYRRSLEIAGTHDLRSIAFPAISTGAYGYPREAAAQIAVQTVAGFAGGPTDVVFCCFSADDTRRYQDLIAILTGPSG